MKIVPVHPVENAQISFCWSNTLSWVFQSPEWSTVVAVLRWAGWHRLRSWVCGALGAPVPWPQGTLCYSWESSCCRRARAARIQFGVSSPCRIFCTSASWSYSLEPECVFSEHGHLLIFFITEGEEHDVPLTIDFYTWNLTKGFGPFIEAEVHGHGRKGRRQLI